MQFAITEQKSVFSQVVGALALVASYMDNIDLASYTRSSKFYKVFR